MPKHPLIYIKDDTPGFTRRRWGRGFQYLDQNGKKISDKKTLARIKSLVIPPMWEEVWISPAANGYLQCTGRDEKKRKQYLYHPDYVAMRQNEKFKKLKDFGAVLPVVREATSGYLRQRRWSREKVLALIVAVLDDCGIRIGNSEYKNRNGTIGLTTLRRKHIDLDDGEMNFDFPGKSGKRRQVTLSDPKLVRLVKQCSELPGYEVFSYFDENKKRQVVDSEEVNEFIHEIIGEGFSAKDFRTWTATSLAVYFFEETRTELKEDPRRKLDTTLVKKVAEELGNTVSVCREYYIHPNILAAAKNEKIPAFELMPGEEFFFHSHDLRSWEKVALGLM